MRPARRPPARHRRRRALAAGCAAAYPRLRPTDSFRSGSWRAPQRLNVGDELRKLLLAELTLKARHDRLVASDDLRLRVEDRAANICLVGGDGRAALERHLRP